MPFRPVLLNPNRINPLIHTSITFSYSLHISICPPLLYLSQSFPTAHFPYKPFSYIPVQIHLHLSSFSSISVQIQPWLNHPSHSYIPSTSPTMSSKKLTKSVPFLILNTTHPFSLTPSNIPEFTSSPSYTHNPITPITLPPYQKISLASAPSFKPFIPSSLKILPSANASMEIFASF